MRDIGSNRITGPEAILTAAIRWWMDQGADIGKLVRGHLAKADPSAFLSRTDLDLGRSLGTAMPTKEVVQSFWDLAGRNHAVRHMVEQAVRSWRGCDTVAEKKAAAREFVERSILTELGSHVKESGFLEENAEEIRRAKRRAKRA